MPVKDRDRDAGQGQRERSINRANLALTNTPEGSMAALPQDISSYGRPAADVRIAKWAPTPHPRLGPFGAECPMSEEESAIVDTLRRFAENEMRPTG